MKFTRHCHNNAGHKILLPAGAFFPSWQGREGSFLSVAGLHKGGNAILEGPSNKNLMVVDHYQATQ